MLLISATRFKSKSWLISNMDDLFWYKSFHGDCNFKINTLSIFLNFHGFLTFKIFLIILMLYDQIFQRSSRTIFQDFLELSRWEWLRAEIHRPLGPWTDRSESIRDFQNCFCPGPVWSEIWKIFSVLVRSSLRFWNFSWYWSGPVRSLKFLMALVRSRKVIRGQLRSKKLDKIPINIEFLNLW